MKSRRDATLVEAFTDSSTDERHHCENAFEYVDRVALSTNRFYMIDVLNPGAKFSLRELQGMTSSAKDNPAERSHEVGLREAAFISFYRHCRAHVDQPRILRAIYLIEAMNKVLSENQSGDYVDALDDRLKRASEAVAYTEQISKLAKEETSEEIRRTLLECVGKNEQQLQIEKDRGVDFIESREISLFRAHNSNSYSQFVVKVIVPILSVLLGRDKSELLSQFTFGIVSIFEHLPPQIYFVKDIETLCGHTLGHCPVPEIRERFPSIDEIMVLSNSEMEEAHKRNLYRDLDLTDVRFNTENHLEAMQEYSLGLACQLGLSLLWRDTLRDACPCDYGKSRIMDCPYQRTLYRRIKRFFVSKAIERQRLCSVNVKRLEREAGQRICPWITRFFWTKSSKRIHRMRLVSTVKPLPGQDPKDYYEASDLLLEAKSESPNGQLTKAGSTFLNKPMGYTIVPKFRFPERFPESER